jgi:hypothetical protein
MYSIVRTHSSPGLLVAGIFSVMQFHGMDCFAGKSMLNRAVFGNGITSKGLLSWPGRRTIVNMKLFAIAAALAASLFAVSASAASWDGTKDDLTVFTVNLNSAIFGVAGIPALLPANSLEIFVSSTDKTVTAFRVTIEYADASGSHTASRVGDASVYMTMAFFAGVSVDAVSSVSVTRLRDAQTTAVKQ